MNSNENRFIYFLNNNKLIQQIGLISFLSIFSINLFLFSLGFMILTVNNLNSFTYVGLVMFLYIISYLNWKYIEVPYQKNFKK